MKSTHSVALMLSLSVLAGCSTNESLDKFEVREICATLNGFKMEETKTRTAYNISELDGFETVWATGDVLGIYPIGGDQVSFPISDGIGTTFAMFDGGSWALRDEYQYAAYYPFSTNCYTISQTAIPVSFLGQMQNGNNTTNHLSAVDFMVAAGTQPENGSVNLQLKHVGSFLRMQFTMPVAATFTEMQLSTNSGTFTTQGTVNLAVATPSLTATNSANTLTLGLSNIKTTSANQTITLYMMVAPDNMSNKTLTFTVKDTNNNLYTKTAAGKDMRATYAYNYALTLEPSGIGDPFNGHAYVDLGLKDEQGHTIYWATCNVGAETPEDYGLYFAWGGTVGYDENVREGLPFDWANAPFNNGSLDFDEVFFNSVKNTVCPNGVLAKEYDAARQNWGGLWRMPTQEEQNQLVASCAWEWNSTKYGYTVTGTNGKSIFLPSAGYGTTSRYIHYVNEYGYYWSSSIFSSIPEYQTQYNDRYGVIIKFRNVEKLWDAESRYEGMPVRAVCIPLE